VRLIVADDAQAAARLAADELVRACLAAIDARGRACLAVSGGTTPWPMLQAFAGATLPWSAIVVAQVDERCVPLEDPRRNLRELQRLLVEQGPLPVEHLLAMPVEQAPPDAAAAAYATRLATVLGADPVFDMVQLGLGEDGHTASLVPHDPVLQVADRAVAVTQPYQATRRMTLTYPVLARARERVWLVTGAVKATALQDLLEGRGDAPAGRLPREDSVVVADRAAATFARP
jgi:6-phosphogluconolactonase